MGELTASLTRPGTSGPSAAVATSGSRALVTLALLLLMVPATFNVGSLLMTPSRALFLVLLPFLLGGLLLGRYGKVTYVDWLVLAYMAWRTFVPFIHNPSVALQYAGSNSVIFLGGYVVARAAVRNVADFQWAVKVLGGIVIFSFPFAVYETVTGNFLLPKLIEQIPGVSSVRDVNYGRRMGLDRVQFVFPHPIHYGLFCSLALSLYFVVLRDVASGFRRWMGTAIIGICCFLSVSSGPFLSALVQIMLFGYGYLARNIERRWRLLGISLGLLYIVVELGSNRPAIVAVTSRLTFNASTANVRFILFDYGMAQIKQTPIIGIGFRSWGLPSWMTGSLDNFWLAIALMFGVPAFLFLFLAIVTGLIGIGKRPFKQGSALSNARLGYEITMVSLTLTLATVYIWSEVASLVMFVLGSGVFLLHAEEPDETGRAGPEPDDPRPRGPAYSRFPAARDRDNGPAAVAPRSQTLPYTRKT